MMAVTRKRRTCVRCDEPGAYITPEGLYCEEHAAEHASRDLALGEESWLPLRVDQPDSAPDPDPGRPEDR